MNVMLFPGIICNPNMHFTGTHSLLAGHGIPFALHKVLIICSSVQAHLQNCWSDAPDQINSLI